MKITWYHSLEQYISTKNNIILAFEKKCGPFYNIFSTKHNLFIHSIDQ